MELQERDALVVKHMALVHKIANQMFYKNRKQYDLDDLISEGAVGLMHACMNYDSSKNKLGDKGFIAYASFRIRGRIQDYTRSSRYGGRFNFFSPCSLDELYELDDNPTINHAKFSKLLQLPVSKDETPNIDLSDILLKAISKLVQQQKFVITEIFFKDKSAMEIAQKLGTTQSYISQVKTKAMQELKTIYNDMERISA